MNGKTWMTSDERETLLVVYYPVEKTEV